MGNTRSSKWPCARDLTVGEYGVWQNMFLSGDWRVISANSRIEKDATPDWLEFGINARTRKSWRFASRSAGGRCVQLGERSA